MLSRLHHWSQHILAYLPAILPSSCALCGLDNSEPICAGCHQQYFAQRGHCCRQCAMPLINMPTQSAQYCGDCLNQPPAYDASVAAVDYGAPIDQLVIALKFGGRLALAPWFARMIRDALLLSDTSQSALPSLLIPVPLSNERLIQRGFNQAQEIARPLSRALGIKLEARGTLRIRNTSAQSTLHPEQRHKNIRHAFMVAPHFVDKLHGLHVGVVDDVMTTGETLNELAATLKRFGAARVTNLVFARTLLK